jgi:DNA-directed RNA polymerase
MPTPATGGYLHRSALIRHDRAAHTAALDRPISKVSLDALNRVQATPWRINRWLLDVAAAAWDRCVPVCGAPLGVTPPLPKRIPDDEWEGMSPEDRKEHIKARRQAFDERASFTGAQTALLDHLTVAQELRDRASIWFPHTMCFRHRIYPQPVSGPNPQASDLGKALLMFATGLPLGPDGLFWLCVRAANCAGQDKLPLEERVQWTLDRKDLIAATATDPFASTWWAETDEPWNLLVTCYELASAMELSSPERFVSHLPIPLDGSCNGLQHLSAMGLDPVGAAATNLQPGPRQDIYEEVAKVVRTLVEEDAAAGVEEALQWHGRITRKVVKRAVMTTPYGVTDRGIRMQLLADGHVPEADQKGSLADYLGDKLVLALGRTVSSGKAIMAWLQTTADRLARAGLPFDWTTPTGSRVRQAYYVQTEKRVRTLAGTLALYEEVKDAALTPRKQALGAAPNYVHSFDAAHLAMTVNAAHEDGMRSFAMIHDSYGTHAHNTTALSGILRDQFASIYRADWLRRTWEEVRSYAPHVDVPAPPPRGSFDIGLVRDAEFFFS